MKVFFAQFIPDMLNRIEFWTVGRLRDEADILRNDQVLGTVPACLIDLHDDEVLRESLADLFQEEIHHGGRGFW